MSSSEPPKRPPKVEATQLIAIKVCLLLAIACFIVAVVSYFMQKDGYEIWFGAMGTFLGYVFGYSTGKAAT